MRLQGKGLTLFTGTPLTAVALAVECSIDITSDMVETTSALSGNARSFRPGRYEWSVSSGHLVETTLGNADVLLAAQLDGTPVAVSVADCVLSDGSLVQGGEWSLSGTAYVQSFRLSGNVGSMARYDVVLRGSGVLTKL